MIPMVIEILVVKFSAGRCKNCLMPSKLDKELFNLALFHETKNPKIGVVVILDSER